MRMIGVTPSQDDKTGRITINQDYLDAITRAGALPVLLPLTAEERLCRAMLARVDGLVLSGGADVEPARYGEERLPCCGAAAPLRDAMEYALCRLAVAADKPVLGICRGLQVLNCALGGSLYQDIGLQFAQAITHPRYDAPRGQVHAVEVLPGTRLEEISGGRKLRVNSRHHQGIKALGRGLCVSARAEDGLTEGVEMPGKRFIVAVQWHPESLSDYAPEAQALFNALVRACQEDA